jgi:hypothetical protein
MSTTRPGEITGYSIALPGDTTTADGQGGQRLVWYGGRKLAPDLTLPRIRQRWAYPGRRGAVSQDAVSQDAVPR